VSLTFCWRCICDSIAQSVRAVIERECGAVVSVLCLPGVCWMLVTLSCWFYTLFLFDTLGDTVGFEGAYWALIVVPLTPVVLYTLALLLTHVIPELHGTESPIQEASRDSELVSVTVSPLV
jgi:H+/Cl- antiporter ClcA